MGPYLLLFVVLLEACGTLGGLHEVVSVDSEPRGLEVFEGTKSIGLTPFFYNMRRARQHRLLVRRPEAQALMPYPVACSFRWQVEVFGSGFLATLNILAVPAAVTVDLLTGAAFDCRSEFFIALAEEDEPQLASGCHRFLIVPPRHPDERVSDDLVNIWVKGVTARLKRCDTILPYRDSKRRLSYFGIDHAHVPSFFDVDRDITNQIGFRTGATDVVYLDYSAAAAEVTVTPTVYDLHRRAVVPAEQWIAKGSEPLSLRPEGLLAKVFEAVRFLPNSVSYGVTDSLLGAKLKRGQQREVVERDTIPRYLAGFSLSSVDHPAAFHDWDVGFQIYPSVEFDYIDRKIRIVDEPSYVFQFMRTTSPLNASVTFHTPIGALSYSYGIGPVIQVGKDSSGTWARSLDVAAVSEFSYIAFMSENLFLELSNTHLQVSRKIANEFVEIASRSQESYLGIGYYMPWARSLVRGL